MKIYSAHLRLLPLVVAIVGSGCAGALPTLELDAARSSIRQAERANAQHFAPELFNSATDRIAKAEVLLQSNRNRRARRLIELADAEAQLAEAVSEAEQSEKSIASLQSIGSIATPQAVSATPQPVVYTNKIDE